MVEYLVWDQGVAGSGPVFPIDITIVRTLVVLFLFVMTVFSIKFGSFLPFVKSIKALSKKRDKTVAILGLLSYF